LVANITQRSIVKRHVQPVFPDQGQSAIRDLFAVKHDRTGNLPLFPAIFPDQFAPRRRA